MNNILMLAMFLISFLFLASCVTAPAQLTTCADLNQQQCQSAITLINHACSWNGTRCIDGTQISQEDVSLGAKMLTAFLTKPQIEPKVADLAAIGVANLKKAPHVQSRLNARENNETGGGRKNDWLLSTFDKSEPQLLTSLENVAAPKTWSLAAIDQAFNDVRKISPPKADAKPPTFTLVQGLGVNYLHDYTAEPLAILQLASQFNFLESMSDNKMSVLKYLEDETQGPQGALEAAAAALHRTGSEETGKLKHALTYVLEGDYSSYYRNGYLEPTHLSDTEQKHLLHTIRKNLHRLLILPQWVICEASGTTQLQVFSAAPSFQGEATPPPGSINEQLSDALVSAQYEALAKIAVIRSTVANVDVPIHLTLVGQGVFKNPASVLRSALIKVAQTVQGYERVKVYIHAFNNLATQKVHDALFETPVSIKVLSATEFKNSTLR